MRLSAIPSVLRSAHAVFSIAISRLDQVAERVGLVCGRHIANPPFESISLSLHNTIPRTIKLPPSGYSALNLRQQGTRNALHSSLCERSMVEEAMFKVSYSQYRGC